MFTTSKRGSAPPRVLRSGTPRSRPAVAVLLAASTLTVMAGALLTPALTPLRADLRLSGTQAGLVLTLHALTLAVASPLVGVLVDRYGLRGPLGIGLVIYGLAGAAGALSSDYSVLLLTRAAFGVGAAAVFTATTVGLIQAATGDRQARLVGWRGATMSLGGVAWPLIGGLTANLTWRASFLTYLVGLPMAVAVWAFLPSNRSAKPQSHVAVGRSPEVLKLPVRQPLLLALYSLFALGTAVLYALLAFLPLRLAEGGTTNPLVVAGVVAAMSLAMSLSGLAFGRLSRRFGVAALLPIAYALSALAFTLLAATSRPALLALAAVCYGAASGLTVPALTLLLGRAVPAQTHGRAMALSGTALFLGQFLSPLLVGPLVDRTSTANGFAVVAIVTGITSAVLAYIAGQRRGRGRQYRTRGRTEGP